MVRTARSSGCGMSCGRSQRTCDRVGIQQKAPADSAAGLEGRMFSLLELDAELADQGLLIALDVIRGDLALSPEIFDAGIDERDRAPDQVDMESLQHPVRDDPLRRPDQRRRITSIGVTVN